MRVALFDLDGTLTDPRVGITRSVNYALARFGLDVADPDELIPYIGPPLRDSFVERAGLSSDDAWKAVLAYREYFTETGMFENAVYPGIAEVIAGLQADGWRLAVATSKPTVFAEQILEHFGLAGFEVVAGCELDGSRQHKHEVITYACEQLGVAPSPAYVMIGDRKHDILGAKRVGIASVGVTWGYGSIKELTAAGADVLVEEIAELRVSCGFFGHEWPHVGPV